MTHKAGIKFGYSILLGICVLILLLLILYPTARMVFRALENWNCKTVLSARSALVIWNTFLLSIVSVICSGIVGTAFAVVLHRYTFVGHSTVATLANLPFALPPLVGGVAFYYLIGRDGLMPRCIEHWLGIPDFYPKQLFAIVLIHTYSFYVFFYAMVGSALESFDYSLIEAARNLGASPLLILFRVVLPLLKPSLRGAALLTFMSSCASFTAPLFFGNGFPVLSVRIYEAASQFKEDEALSLTLALAVLSLGGLALFRSRSTMPTRGASKGVRHLPKTSLSLRISLPCILVFLTVLLAPHATILWLSFIDHTAWHTELLPTHFTWGNYTKLFEDPAALKPLLNSFRMSAYAVLAVFLVGLPIAHWLAAKRPGSKWLSILVMMPWALPGTVVAMNLLVAANDPWVPAQMAVVLLPIAYFVRSIPLFTRISVAALESVDSSLLEAARTLGASSVYGFRRITLPLVGPAWAAGGAMVFVSCLGEFVTSILLYRPENTPISVQINMFMRGVGIGTAFAYSTILLLFNISAFALARRFSSRIL
ncbi:MAG TPA: iron ABC transporter permease [Candidatus Hydrogenedentes bacterium]|nr:iron ABC transporter permease [Candidatus Hydrogenedentota bacterium]HOL78216.1 iron ABC transporter permease [Candidatus Hydrogenedentota bacterium]HPO84521.1 iron ABC transporter permease [Candidatus Hydrogenedentota bacterium]